MGLRRALRQKQEIIQQALEVWTALAGFLRVERIEEIRTIDRFLVEAASFLLVKSFETPGWRVVVVDGLGKLGRRQCRPDGGIENLWVAKEPSLCLVNCEMLPESSDAGLLFEFCFR